MPPVNRGYTRSVEPGEIATSGALVALRVKIQSNTTIAKVLNWAKSVVLNKRLTEELNGYKITARNLAKPGVYEYGVNLRFMNPRQDVINICEAVLKIQAYRDRTCEIQLDLLRQKNNLLRWRQLGSDMITELYATEIQRLCRNADMQRDFIYSVLSPITMKLSVVAGQIEQVEAVLKNLDKAHYAYQEVGELANNILSRSEGGHAVGRSA